MNPNYGKDILTLTELSKDEILHLLKVGVDMKKNPEKFNQELSGKILGMIFEKASTRTRVSFEAGIIQLGGQAVVLSSKDTQLGRGEPIKDTAKILSGYLDAIMIRTFKDRMVEELAENASVPVINGLTDDHHPCQVLADLMTIYEIKGKVDGLKLAYVGDGNNMAHSLMIGGAIVGLDVSVAAPVGYEPKQEYVALAKELAKTTGATIEVTTDAAAAVRSADFIYTDVWASMGWEGESDARLQAFKDNYQVNEALVANAAENYTFLHCLPAHRGEEVTEEIIDGPHSAIYQEAENRLHVQKALLVHVMKK